MNWLWNALVWLDARINDKWLGGYHETISGRCYRSDCWCCRWLCRMLHKVDPNHCRNSYHNDRSRNPNLPTI